MRKGDELVFLADAVGEMEKGLIERMEDCRRAVAEIEEEAGKIESESGGAAAADLKKAVARLDTSDILTGVCQLFQSCCDDVMDHKVHWATRSSGPQRDSGPQHSRARERALSLIQ